jgi:hypothetical protein
MGPVVSNEAAQDNRPTARWTGPLARIRSPRPVNVSVSVHEGPRRQRDRAQRAFAIDLLLKEDDGGDKANG